MAELVIANAAEVLTCARKADDLVGRIPGAGVVVEGGRIVYVGPLRPDDLASAATLVDAAGGVVLPGFVDSHTHVVFGRSRVQEFAARAARREPPPDAPLGIVGTAVATRDLTVAQLVAEALQRLDAMLRHGTTTVESKSGYGLRPDAELRILETNRELNRLSPVDVVSTYLGAHAIPPGTTRGAYVDAVVDLIPEIAGRGLAEFCDVYCDEGYFTTAETERILRAGIDHGLRPKLHLDAYSATGAARLAVEVGAVSVDHLNYTPPDEVRALAAAGIRGVYLPTLELAVGHEAPLRARALADAGLELAVATDVCPACWAPDLTLAMALACRTGRLSVAEAIRGVTLVAADALGRGDEIGTLEVSKRADIVVVAVPEHAHLAYRIGAIPVTHVVKNGVVVVGEAAVGEQRPTPRARPAGLASEVAR
ncbi:MAG: imidazolonepropionase [Solirubrobacterales bacterium]